MSYKVLEISDSTLQSAIWAQIDATLPQTCEGDPNGQLAAARPGLFATNKLNNALYLSVAGDDTVENTEWQQLIFSIIQATDTEYGVVRIATAEEVAEGVRNDVVVTPFGMAEGLATQAELQDEINDRSSADTSMSIAIAALNVVITAASASANASTLMKRDPSGRSKVAAAVSADEIVIKSQMDAADTALQAQVDPLTFDLADATDAAAANKLARRDNTGKLKATAGTATTEVVNFTQLDATNTTVAGHTSTLSTYGANITTLQSDLTTDIANLAAEIIKTAKLPGYSAATTLTMSNGGTSVTPTQGWHQVDTYNNGASQTLSTLATTNSVKLLIVQPLNATHVITLKHYVSGGDNIYNRDSKDIVFQNTDQSVLYALVGANYREIARFGFVEETTFAQTSNFTAKYNSHNICDTSSGNITFTLPTAVGFAGAVIYVWKKASANSLIAAFTSSQTANGSGSWTLTTQYTGYRFVSDGANWVVELLTQSQSTGTTTRVNNYRLSLSSTDPEPGDINVASTIYLKEYNGDALDIYNGSSWNTYTALSLSIAVPSTQYFRIYDVFIDYNSGTPQLALTAWDSGGQVTATITGATAANPCVITTSAAHGLSVGDKIGIKKGTGTGTGWTDTNMGLDGKEFYVSAVGSATTATLEGCDTSTLTFSTFTGSPTLYKIPSSRTTAIVRQNGIWCMSGTLTKRLLGTFKTNSAGTVDDHSGVARNLSNVDNQCACSVKAIEPAANWSSPSVSKMVARSGSLLRGTTRFEFVLALPQTVQFTDTDVSNGTSIASAISLNRVEQAVYSAMQNLVAHSTGGYGSAYPESMTGVESRALAAGSYFAQKMAYGSGSAYSGDLFANYAGARAASQANLVR